MGGHLDEGNDKVRGCLDKRMDEERLHGRISLGIDEGKEELVNR